MEIVCTRSLIILSLVSYCAVEDEYVMLERFDLCACRVYYLVHLISDSENLRKKWKLK